MKKLLFIFFILTINFSFIKAQTESSNICFNFGAGFSGIGTELITLKYKNYNYGTAQAEMINEKINKNFTADLIFHGGIHFQLYKSLYIGLYGSQIAMYFNDNKEININLEMIKTYKI